MTQIMAKKNSLLCKLNRFFLSRVGGVIVLGPSHVGIYSNTLPAQKIHAVPNFAEDYLFASKIEIAQKFSCLNPLRLLFLSNFLPGKGFNELRHAYSELDEHARRKVQLDFAGDFPSDDEKDAFLHTIQKYEGIRYHGPVSGDRKRHLFSHAHLFCLPTYYPYEGQPIAILEAYASGCAVLTTNHSGIRDVFADRVNGYEVAKGSSDSVKRAIEYILQHPDELTGIGLANSTMAVNRYRTSIYAKAMQEIIEQTGANSNEVIYAQG